MNTTLRAGGVLVALATLVTAAACGGGAGGPPASSAAPGGGTGPGAGSAPVATVRVDPGSLALTAGGAALLTATPADAAGRPVSGLAVAWSSTDPGAARVVATGPLTAVVEGVALGRASVTARAGALASNAVPAQVAAAPGPNFEPVDPELATPAPGALYDVPVAIVRYIPTTDFVNVDASVAGFGGTIADLRARLRGYDRRLKLALEEGSRFRGYANPTAPPSLGYRVTESVTLYEPVPPGQAVPGDPTKRFPDYHDLLGRIGGQHLVESRGVKELWVWAYHHGAIVPVESNMASPLTGDISNSHRSNTDMPVYRNTYTVYTYNAGRSQSEAIHNHGHQLEAILAHVDQLATGTTDLFWNRFVGKDSAGRHIAGRCGWTHMPPNTTQDYDYLNPTPVLSDIEDWTPAGTGARKSVGKDTWAQLPYAWPGAASFPQKDEAQWYVYWMQSMPGAGNPIRYGTRRLSNWWQFTGDWDNAIRQGRTLTE